PVAAITNTNSRDVMSWGDVNNKSVPLSVEQLKGLSEAMALALMERNNRIYQRQREMKDEVAGLMDLKAVRDFTVSDI
ncbi:DUF4376 domain-containing protein, partial [Yersinia enterocolitica]